MKSIPLAGIFIALTGLAAYWSRIRDWYMRLEASCALVTCHWCLDECQTGDTVIDPETGYIKCLTCKSWELPILTDAEADKLRRVVLGADEEAF